MAYNLDRPKSAKRLNNKVKNGSSLIENDVVDDEEGEDSEEDLSQEFDLMAYGVNKSVAEASIDDNENDRFDTRRPLCSFTERGKISKGQYMESKGYDSVNDKGVSDLFGDFLFTDPVHETTSVIKVKDMGDSIYLKESTGSSFADKSDNISTHSRADYSYSQSSPKKQGKTFKPSLPIVETSQALSSSYPELRKASGLRVLKEIRERKNCIEKSRSRKTKLSDSRSESSSRGSGQSTPIDKEKESNTSNRPSRRPPAKLKPLLLSQDEIYDT